MAKAREQTAEIVNDEVQPDQMRTLIQFGNQREISPEFARAATALQTGRIPKSDLSTHPGKGGKTFTYVKHTYVNRLLIDAMGLFWGMKVRDPQIMDDGTAICIVTLITYVPMGDTLVPVEIEEIGAHQDLTDKMCKAHRIASAASRGLVKCVMRRFGVGLQLYEESDVEMGADDAWNVLRRAAQAKKLPEAELVEALKERGFTADNLLDQFAKAYQLVYDLADARSKAKLPSALGGKESKPKAEAEEPKAEEPKPEVPVAPTPEEKAKLAYVQGILYDLIVEVVLKSAEYRTQEERDGAVDAATLKSAAKKKLADMTLAECEAASKKLYAARGAWAKDENVAPMFLEWAQTTHSMSEDAVVKLLGIYEQENLDHKINSLQETWLSLAQAKEVVASSVTF